MSNSKITPALKKTLRAVEKLGEANAKTVAEQTGREYGRESSYLNKLRRMGVLIKRRDGHQSLFSMKPVQLTILKLGGSVITDKEKPFTVNFEAVKRLSTEIASALKSEKGPRRLIIVFGGGSFGHPIAMKYDLRPTASPIENKETVKGLSHLQHKLTQLNSTVVGELIKNNVPAYPIAPQGGLYQPDGNVSVRLLTLLLNLEFVPVTHAFALIDNQKNLKIISGDEMVYILASLLKPSRVFLGVDVDGLYPADPQISPEAKVIEELYANTLDEIMFGPTKYVDVTGGMLGKARWALGVARLGIEVKIVNGTKPDVLEKALCGEKVLGTVIRA